MDIFVVHDRLGEGRLTTEHEGILVGLPVFVTVDEARLEEGVTIRVTGRQATEREYLRDIDRRLADDPEEVARLVCEAVASALRRFIAERQQEDTE